MSAHSILNDTAGTEQQKDSADKDGAVDEELLRQDQNDLIGIHIEHPVILARKEYGMEGREERLKINQAPDQYNGENDEYRDPQIEAHAVSLKGAKFKTPLFPQDQQHNTGRQRNYRQYDNDPEDHFTVGKVTFAVLRPSQGSRLKGRIEQ